MCKRCAKISNDLTCVIGFPKRQEEEQSRRNIRRDNDQEFSKINDIPNHGFKNLRKQQAE